MCLDLYVHWVSRSMHLTELKQSDWVISAWIINEFEKNQYTTVIKHEHKRGRSLVFYVIMTPFPFYKNMLNFSGWSCSYKNGALLPNFSLVFLIHLFLYVGVYCIRLDKTVSPYLSRLELNQQMQSNTAVSTVNIPKSRQSIVLVNIWNKHCSSRAWTNI